MNFHLPKEGGIDHSHEPYWIDLIFQPRPGKPDGHGVWIRLLGTAEQHAEVIQRLAPDCEAPGMSYDEVISIPGFVMLTQDHRGHTTVLFGPPERVQCP